MVFSILLLALPMSVVVHEIGHAVAATMLRLPWRLTLTRYGPGIRIGSDAIRLTRRQITVTAVAGPLANLALASVAYQAGLALLVLCSLEVAFVNLLPFPRSDGRRILRGQEI